MPRYGSEEFYINPYKLYQGGQATPDTLNLINSATNRGVDIQAKVGEDMARSIRERGDLYKAGITGAVQNYQAGKRNAAETDKSRTEAEEGQVKLEDSRRQQQWLDQPVDDSGKTRRQQMAEEEAQDKKLDRATKTALLKKQLTEGDIEQARWQQDQQKFKMEQGSNLYKGAKSPEEIAQADAAAKRLGYTADQMAIAKGAGYKEPDAQAKNIASLANQAQQSHVTASAMEQNPNYHVQNSDTRMKAFWKKLSFDSAYNENDKAYNDSKDAFITAVAVKRGLKKEDIRKGMEENYFATENDTPETLQRKAAARQQILDDMYAETQGYGDPTKVAKIAPPTIKNGSSMPSAVAAPAGPQPQTVIQNGHTYHLNPKTGQYE